MNLIIDQGNTAIKLAIYNKKRIVDQISFLSEDVSKIDDWLQKKADIITSSIISSVTNSSIKFIKSKNENRLNLDHLTPVPIKNCYLEPKSLGYDRLANAVAVWSLNPNNFSLSIDVGTCIKYDIVNSKGEYLGGNISPGLQMRFNALHQQTDKLPLLNPRKKEQLYGKDTNSSIQIGVIDGIIHEINGFIRRYTDEFKGLTIFMTGGDSKYFDKELKNPIFADSDLTLKGLNEILNYNVANK